MDQVILATVLTGAAGLFFGIILAVFSKIMAVPVDSKQEDIRAMLPSVNCGACGYTTCDGYSAVLASGAETRTNLCLPGGKDTVVEISNYLGEEVEEIKPTTSMVMCKGSSDVTSKRASYFGVTTCSAASQLEGGDQTCRFGCLGYGDCVAVCQYDAIHVVNGVAVVDPAKCTSCTMCIRTCPKKIIELLPMEHAQSMVLCHNEDKAALANKVCQVSCIACKRCVKACPEQCISMVNDRAVIDYPRCTNCGKCQEVCPHDCILSLFPADESVQSAVGM